MISTVRLNQAEPKSSCGLKGTIFLKSSSVVQSSYRKPDGNASNRSSGKTPQWTEACPMLASISAQFDSSSPLSVALLSLLFKVATVFFWEELLMTFPSINTIQDNTRISFNSINKLFKTITPAYFMASRLKIQVLRGLRDKLWTCHVRKDRRPGKH